MLIVISLYFIWNIFALSFPLFSIACMLYASVLICMYFGIKTIINVSASHSCRRCSIIHSSLTIMKTVQSIRISFSMTNLVSKLQPWRSSEGRWEPYVWEPCSQPRGKLRVTLILLFVAGPIGVHPPPSQHASLLHSLSLCLTTVLRCLPSWLARYTPWLLKPLERVRWLRYSVSSYARFVYQTVGGDCTGAKQKVARRQDTRCVY